MTLLRPNRSRDSAHVAEVLGHELRNPLASAVASIGVAMEMTDAGDPRSAFLGRALQDLSRVSTLLTRCLDLGRAGNPASEELDLVEVVARVARRHQGSAVLVELEAAVPGDRPAVLRGDPVLLERLVDNLVENAVAMGARRLDLFIEHDGADLVLQVSDDGPGVAAEVREHLFEPHVSGRGSTGLGLALCREVAEAHGGSITLVPSATGAVFRVTIPS